MQMVVSKEAARTGGALFSLPRVDKPVVGQEIDYALGRSGGK